LVLSHLSACSGVHKIEIPTFEFGWLVDTSQEEILLCVTYKIFFRIQNLDFKATRALSDRVVEISNREYGLLKHVSNIWVFKLDCQHA